MPRRWINSVAIGAAMALLTNGCATHAPVRSAEDLADFHRRTENATLELIRNDGSVEKVHEAQVADGFLRAYRHDEFDEVRVPISEIRTVRQRERSVGFAFYSLVGSIAGLVAGGAYGIAATNEGESLRGAVVVATGMVGLGVGGVAGGTVGLVRGIHVNHDLSEYRIEMDAASDN